MAYVNSLQTTVKMITSVELKSTGRMLSMSAKESPFSTIFERIFHSCLPGSSGPTTVPESRDSEHTV